MLNKRLVFVEKLCRNSNGAKTGRKCISGEDEGTFETKLTEFYKNVLITLQSEISQKVGGQCSGAPSPSPGCATDDNVKLNLSTSQNNPELEPDRNNSF